MKQQIVWSGLALSSLVMADNLSFDGDYRARFESFENMNEKYYGTNPKLGEADDSYLLSRLILGMRYKPTSDLMLRVSLEDSRVIGWGFSDSNWYSKEFNQEHSTQKDLIDLHDCFVKYKHDNLSITAGRQRIAYGDLRVYGPGEWKNASKWYWDAVKVSYKEDKNFLDVFYGKNILHDPHRFSLDHRDGYTGAGLYGHYVYRDTAAIEPILAYKKNDTKNEVYNALETYYSGFRAYDEDFHSFFYDTLYIKSTGDYTKLNNQKVDIDALGYHLEGGYKLKAIKTKVGMGYTYASGDDPNSEERETFDAVFGASDKYYGRLNLFSWDNLVDKEIFAVYNGIPKAKIKLEYHKFYADEPTDKWKTYKIATMTHDHYGDEFDIMATYAYNKNLDLLFGVGTFTPGDYIKEASTKDQYITDDNAYAIYSQFEYKF